MGDQNASKLISICCITYNQEKYIAYAIEGFLKQTIIDECEILIHDDASTDGTLNIIRQYAGRYPHKIHILCEEESQYQTKGIQIFPILFKKAKGKYIALCEGDDYWIDENKLKKQKDFMESNAEYSMVFHGTKIYGCFEQKFLKDYHSYVASCRVLFKDIVENEGGFIPTASIFFRTESVQDMPKYYNHCIIGDYALQLILASKGEVYYIDEEMSVYRKNTENSLAVELYNSNSKLIRIYNEHIQMLEHFNKYSNYKYKDIVNSKRMYYQFSILYLKNDLYRILSRPMRVYFNSFSATKKIKVILKCMFPRIYGSLKVRVDRRSKHK